MNVRLSLLDFFGKLEMGWTMIHLGSLLILLKPNYCSCDCWLMTGGAGLGRYYRTYQPFMIDLLDS